MCEGCLLQASLGSKDSIYSPLSGIRITRVSKGRRWWWFGLPVVSDSATSWTAARQASLSVISSWTAACRAFLSTVSQFAHVHVHCIGDGISSPDALFSFCPQSFPASGTFPMSRLFTSDDQNTGWSFSSSPSSDPFLTLSQTQCISSSPHPSSLPSHSYSDLSDQ